MKNRYNEIIELYIHNNKTMYSHSIRLLSSDELLEFYDHATILAAKDELFVWTMTSMCRDIVIAVIEQKRESRKSKE